MAYQPLAGIERKEIGGGVGILPPDVYVCVITDARIGQSKKGEMALLVTWDVAEGEHKGHFAGAEFGHTDWLMLEGSQRGWTAFRLDKLSAACTSGPVTFDATAYVDQEAAQYDSFGRVGEQSVAQLNGKYIGMVIGIRAGEYQGKKFERNEVNAWVTPQEARDGKYTDKDGNIKDIKQPTRRVEKSITTATQTASTQQESATDDGIPF